MTVSERSAESDLIDAIAAALTAAEAEGRRAAIEEAMQKIAARAAAARSVHDWRSAGELDEAESDIRALADTPGVTDG